MIQPLKVCGTAIAVVALGVALTSCGSKTATTTSSSTSASSSSKTSAPSSTSKPSETPAAGKNETIADYIKEAGLTETPIKRGDPGAPTIDLPVPDGWQVAGDKTPAFAYGAIIASDPAMASDPPSIIAIVSKLTGNVDKAKLVQYAPGELNNLPGFDGPKTGEPTTLSGFDAVQLGGSYVKDGVQRMIAQKTVIIPAADGSGMFVLQLNADGTEDQMAPLMDATSVIDEKTTITP
jgi:Probable lipoprotein LpqN